jgi:triacylglycerol lipase
LAESVGAVTRLLPAASRVDVQAFINGLFGDRLADSGSLLAIPMTVRSAEGSVLPLHRSKLAGALPGATGRLVVFVHGLMCTESIWRPPAEPAQPDYGERLCREHGVTPVYVRYNTGRHISLNGRELAGLLDSLVAAWPVRVHEIDLVGHSMGGLVVRSACHYGRALTPRFGRWPGGWVRRVRRIVLLGVPNTGADLEVVANQVSTALWALPNPVTRLVAHTLDHRSDGIKDLRFGFTRDDDWQERDPSLAERPVLHPLEIPRRARYLAISGSLARSEANPVSQLLGDALVTAPSAAGRLRDEEIGLLQGATVCSCAGVAHLALAHHETVYREIGAWW